MLEEDFSMLALVIDICHQRSHPMGITCQKLVDIVLGAVPTLIQKLQKRMLNRCVQLLPPL